MTNGTGSHDSKIPSKEEKGNSSKDAKASKETQATAQKK